MKFEQVFEQYLLNSTVSEHQAKFLWNHAIKQIEDRIICNFHPDCHDQIYKICEKELQPIVVPDYFNLS